jgi:hypothetical protein
VRARLFEQLDQIGFAGELLRTDPGTELRQLARGHVAAAPAIVHEVAARGEGGEQCGAAGLRIARQRDDFTEHERALDTVEEFEELEHPQRAFDRKIHGDRHAAAVGGLA